MLFIQIQYRKKNAYHTILLFKKMNAEHDIFLRLFFYGMAQNCIIGVFLSIEVL